ncbi:MAG TPA: prepilin-type N-terminal cleavage/methylation domain-containing protein [Vicinamibacterales bacterium]|nr:prepilin-type N-terminal cleavage/methylation domain-containing protein [Vicinamibacterales bacterium]
MSTLGMAWPECESRDARPRWSAARGFTLMELMVVMALIAILVAVAFARYSRAKISGSEASALASLRTIAEAEWSFAQTCGNQKYAPTLVALGQPVPATGEGFLSPDLTSGETIEKSGYTLHLTAAPAAGAPAACNGAAVADGFAATADPTRPGATGIRYYGVNAGRVLYQDTRTFTGNLPENGAPGHGTEVR